MGFTLGKSWYNSAQINYRYRTRSGLTLTTAYTLSKWMERTAWDDNITGKFHTRLSGNDQKHVFKIVADYELPFGRNKRFLAHTGSFASRVIGGWVVNTTFQSQSGAL